VCVDGVQLQTHINSVRLGVGRERLGIGKLGIASGSLDEHARQAGEIGGEGVDDGIIVWVPRQIRGRAAKGAVDRDRRRRRVGGRAVRPRSEGDPWTEQDGGAGQRSAFLLEGEQHGEHEAATRRVSSDGHVPGRRP
jgi:hypothetical protein